MSSRNSAALDCDSLLRRCRDFSIAVSCCGRQAALRRIECFNGAAIDHRTHRNHRRRNRRCVGQAKVYDEYRPKGVAAAYRSKDDVVAIKLATGVELALPRKLLQGLENATPAQLAKVTIVGAQSGLHWESLDVDHYVPSLIEGVFGSRR